MWESIKFVSSGLALIAFIIGVAASVYQRKLLQKERLIQSVPEDKRADLLKRELEFFDIDTSDLTKQQQYNIALDQIHARKARFRIGLITVIILGFLASAVAVFAIWMDSSTKIYRIRIMILGPDISPYNEEVNIQSSVGGETKQINGGWEIDIPAENLPENKKVTIRAFRESAFLSGKQDLELGSDFNPAVTLQLMADKSAMVTGHVLNKRRNPLGEARVSIIGSPEEFITKEDGYFELPGHAARGQQVKLRVEKVGYKTYIEWVPAGHPIIVELEKR